MRTILLVIFAIMLAGTCKAQSFDFSCAPPIVFAESNNIWSTISCSEYSYSLEQTTVANKLVWEVTFYGITRNNYLASTEQSAHTYAQTQIKLLCGI